MRWVLLKYTTPRAARSIALVGLLTKQKTPAGGQRLNMSSPPLLSPSPTLRIATEQLAQFNSDSCTPCTPSQQRSPQSPAPPGSPRGAPLGSFSRGSPRPGAGQQQSQRGAYFAPLAANNNQQAMSAVRGGGLRGVGSRRSRSLDGRLPGTLPADYLGRRAPHSPLASFSSPASAAFPGGAEEALGARAAPQQPPPPAPPSTEDAAGRGNFAEGSPTTRSRGSGHHSRRRVFAAAAAAPVASEHELDAAAGAAAAAGVVCCGGSANILPGAVAVTTTAVGISSSSSTGGGGD